MTLGSGFDHPRGYVKCRYDRNISMEELTRHMEREVFIFNFEMRTVNVGRGAHRFCSIVAAQRRAIFGSWVVLNRPQEGKGPADVFCCAVWAWEEILAFFVYRRLYCDCRPAHDTCVASSARRGW